MRSVVAIALTLVGLVLLAVSYLMPPMGNGGWTDADADRYNEVNRTLLILHYSEEDHGHSHGTTDAQASDRPALEAERDELSSRLAAAQQSRSRWADVAFVLGLFALVGALSCAVAEVAARND